MLQAYQIGRDNTAYKVPIKDVMGGIVGRAGRLTPVTLRVFWRRTFCTT